MTQRNTRLRWRSRQVAAALASTLFAAAGGAAPESGSEETVPAAEAMAAGEDVPAAATAAPSGLRAFIDPETGELTSQPTAEQLRSFVLASRLGLSRSFVGLQPFVLDDGGRGVNLQGRFQSALRVERMPDGSFRATCGDPAHAGDDAHRHHASSRPSPSSLPAER